MFVVPANEGARKANAVLVLPWFSWLPVAEKRRHYRWLRFLSHLRVQVLSCFCELLIAQTRCCTELYSWATLS